MKVCLTGDVHHMSMETRDQSYLPGTEIEAALEYARIAAEYDIEVTLFVTGRSALEEPDRYRRLARMDSVEIGGHNHFAYHLPFLGSLPYNTCYKTFGVYSPAIVQKLEVRRALSALSVPLEETIVSWRNHAYRNDRNTTVILADAGLKFLSDVVSPDYHEPYHEDGLTMVPINTLPDHEHMYHAFRTEEYVDRLDWRNEFTDQSFHPKEWAERVLSQINAMGTGVATVLAHPACMSIADRFETFRRLCRGIQKYETQKMRAVETDLG